MSDLGISVLNLGLTLFCSIASLNQLLIRFTQSSCLQV